MGPQHWHAVSARSERLALLLSRTMRPLAEGWDPRGRQLVLMRALADSMGAVRGPFGARVRRQRESAVRGLWVRADGARYRDGVILYLHGGGFVFGSTRSHFGIAKRLSRESGLAVFLLDYRLAPEHPFPAAADDALAAYRWLLAQGVRASRIALAGDSAGGHLVTSVLADLVRGELPLPAAALVISPVLDLRGERASERHAAHPDPLMSTEYGRKCIQAYLGDEDPLHPRLDVLNAPMRTWPPTLIQVGDTECLIDDARDLAAAMADSGAVSELQVWPGQVHVFQAYARWLPEARQALRSGGQFLRRHVIRADDSPLESGRFRRRDDQTSTVGGD